MDLDEFALVQQLAGEALGAEGDEGDQRDQPGMLRAATSETRRMFST
ncbi:MAG: hypothetical protein R3D03_04640 [Geminicoccaceae bacterium]